MKKKIYIVWLIALCMTGCTEEKRPEIVINTEPPKPVTDVQVTNIPGGAILKYQLPDDEDLLYVKAAYSYKDGHQAEARSSLYCDSIKILGFGTEDVRTVELRAVDRSNNESAPVSATIQPLEPPVNTIGKTLELMPDFGGVHLYWKNPERAEISVILEKEDNNNEYIPVEIFYSTVVEGDAASRGMDTIPGNFRVYIQDRWENQSTVLEGTLTPLFEAQFDRLKFQALYIDGDEPTAWGWVLPQIFDGDLTTGFHTAQGTGRWPQWVTFDLGIKGKISRIKVWQRQEDWEFRHGNLKHFEIWGTNEVNQLADWDVWTMMIDCVSVKPSGLPMGQLSDEDRAAVAGGEEFICPPDMPAVRYLRLKALENWSGGDFFHIMEVEVYGQVEE
ncbi:MAG: DUF4959 domain-containing protein [Tannerellaceae bacterium]|nr:DUF4959 domain-containing protein [Tannerellaceae bacterium]